MTLTLSREVEEELKKVQEEVNSGLYFDGLYQKYIAGSEPIMTKEEFLEYLADPRHIPG